MDVMNFTDAAVLPKDDPSTAWTHERFVDFAAPSRGYAYMYEFDERTGATRLFHKGDNMVVASSRQILAQLLAGNANASAYRVAKAYFGNVYYNDPNPDRLLKPAQANEADFVRLSDTRLVQMPEDGGTEAVIETLRTVTEHDAGAASGWLCQFTLKLSWSNVVQLPEGEPGFRMFTEMGLFAAGEGETPIMYSRKVFPSWMLVPGRGMMVVWGILF